MNMCALQFLNSNSSSSTTIHLFILSLICDVSLFVLKFRVKCYQHQRYAYINVFFLNGLWITIFCDGVVSNLFFLNFELYIYYSDDFSDAVYAYCAPWEIDNRNTFTFKWIQIREDNMKVKRCSSFKIRKFSTE